MRLKFNGILPRVMLWVLPAATLVLLVIDVATNAIVERTFLKKSEAGLERDANFAVTAIASRINAFVDATRSVAQNDLVINGLVDAEAREAYVPLYFNQLRIGAMRDRHKVAFIDYRGRVIAANWKASDYVSASWLDEVVGKATHHIELRDGSATLAVPVLFQGHAEGAIVVELGRKQLSELVTTSLGRNAVLVTGFGSTIFSNDENFRKAFADDTALSEDWMHVAKSVPGFPELRLVVALNNDIAYAAVHELELSLLIGLLIALVALAIGIFATAYLTSDPIRKFVQNLKSFTNVKDLDRRVPSNGPKEFQDLANAFNGMLERLQSVVVSNDQLEQENEMRRRVERRLQTQNERFNIALENMSQGLCVFDRDQRIVVCNDQYATLYGLSPFDFKAGTEVDEIVQLRIKAGVYTRESVDKFYKDLQSWREEEHNALTCVDELSDGRAIKIQRQPLMDGGWVTTNEDVTEALRVERLKNEFVSIVSHELRTPLTSLYGSLRLVVASQAGNLPQQAKQLIEIACRNAESLSRLVDDILDIEKVRSDKMSFEYKAVDIVSLAKQACERTRAYGAKFDVELKLEEDLGQAFAMLDEDRVMQVLANLLSNAIKFSPADSDVVLRISRDAGVLRVAVIDKGEGIAEKDQARIFERFYQIDASDSRCKEGTGLGLPIAKAIVEKHDSHLCLDSELGQGSTFHFELREVSATETVETPSPEPAELNVY